MPQIEQGYGHAMYTRTARKMYRCTHVRHIGLLNACECAAAILPGEPYVESVSAPYYESPFYKVTTDPDRPWGLRRGGNHPGITAGFASVVLPKNCVHTRKCVSWRLGSALGDPQTPPSPTVPAR